MSDTLPKSVIAGAARELEDKDPMRVTFPAITVFQLVAVLQLALRHPTIKSLETGDAFNTADDFIKFTREYFYDCPNMIAAGFDPRFDE
jgi:hypothetical protein